MARKESDAIRMSRSSELRICPILIGSCRMCRTLSSPILLTLLLSPVLGSTLALADEPAKAEGRKVSVSATASIEADPDTAVLTFVVTSTGTLGKDARESANKRAQTITEGIAKMDIKSISVNVVPVPLSPMIAAEAGADGSQSTVAYQARTQFTVTVRDTDKEALRYLVVRVADIAVASGAVGPSDDMSTRFRSVARFGGGGPAMPP